MKRQRAAAAPPSTAVDKGRALTAEPPDATSGAARVAATASSGTAPPAAPAVHGPAPVGAKKQPRVNLGATCYQVAPTYFVAAALKTAVMVVHDGASAAASACGASLQECLPVYEVLLELCIRLRDGAVVDKPFVLSVSNAIGKYCPGFSPDSQEHAGLFLGSFASSLNDELLSVVPVLSACTPVSVQPRPVGPPCSVFVCVMAKLASFLAPMLLSHAAHDAAWDAGVRPDLVPLSALLASDPSSWRADAAYDGPTSYAIRSAALCATVLRTVASAPASGTVAVAAALSLGSYVYGCLVNDSARLSPLHAAGLRALAVSLARRDLGTPSLVLRDAIAESMIAIDALAGALDDGVAPPQPLPTGVTRAALMKACDAGGLGLAVCLRLLTGCKLELAAIVADFEGEHSARIVAAAAVLLPSLSASSAADALCLQRLAEILTVLVGASTTGDYPGGSKLFDVADDIIGWLLRPDTLELRDSAVDLGVAILLRRGPGVTESRLFARTVRIIVCDASSTDADVAARSLRHLVAVGDVLLTECSFSDTSVDFVKRARSAFCRAALQWEVHATPGGRHFLDAVATEVPGLLLAAHVQYCRSAPASRIPDNFMRGTVQRSMACPLCKQEVSADSPESFEVLHLDMPERAVRHSLGDLLGLFFFRDRPFEEPYACSGCLGRALEAKAGARSTSVLSVPPTVLILDIKRYVENYAADADDAYVSYAELRPDALRFPLVLDLGPYASSRESCVYDLYATANYSGAGEVGHYVAYTLGLHPAFSSWSLSNDCVPTAATTADVLGAAAGYVTQLCYFRRETPKAGVVDLTEDDDPAGGAAGGAGGGAGAAVCFLDDDDDL